MIATAACAIPGAAGPTGRVVRPGAPGKPNILVILTDDQRWDSLGLMPNVQRDLVAKGVNFANTFVVNSLCCPSRASILTGKYSHGTGVYSIGGTYGGFGNFKDGSTVATWLHSDGYHTGLIGKYFNEYHGTYVPPGWDYWAAITGVKYGEVSGYYNYNMNQNGVLTSYGSAPNDYATDVLAAKALGFLDAAPLEQPFFLYLATTAPHGPWVAAPRHRAALENMTFRRPASYFERDVSDKPARIRSLPYNPLTQDKYSAQRRAELRPLLAVDDAVGAIVNKLAASGRLSNTVIFFLSDNGLMLGEHRYQGKSLPYEESIRVPMVIRFDPLTAMPRRDGHLVTNIDVAPTVAALAGIATPPVDGMNIVPLLASTSAPWRQDFLVEHMKAGVNDPSGPSFCAVRDTGGLYVKYQTGEQELYDLRADPYELNNVALDSAYASRRNAMYSRLKVLCSPPPPGFSP